MASVPAKWVSALLDAPDRKIEPGEGLPFSLQVLGGLGGAVGYWLPTGLNNARDSARRLAKIGT